MTDTLDGLLSSLGRASWQGALAFALVWLLCRALARRLTADAHCWLWRLGYVKLLVGLLWGGVLLLPVLSPAPRPVVAQPRLTLITSPHPVGPSEAGAGDATLPVSVSPEARPRLGWQTALAAAYVFGVVVCLGRLLRAARRTQCILRHAAPNVTEPETACAAGLARDMGLRRVPALARSAEVSSPVLIAGGVLLPSKAQYDKDELRMILAHELAHARRRDLAWEWLGTLVQVVFFFHPLVVLARREERLAREAAADALALKTTGAAATDYGRLLLSLSLAQGQPRPAMVGAVGVIEGGSPLRRRLLALRDGAARTNTRRNRWRLALFLVPLLALAFVPWQMTHGQAPPPAPQLAPVAPASPRMPAGDKRIVGTVRDEMGKPVAGLTVCLDWHWSQAQHVGGPVTGTRPVANVTTDADGRFAISRLPAGDFDYGVTSPADQYVAVGGRLVISEAEAQKTLDLTLPTGSLVTGRVVDGRTGKPMTKVVVALGPAPRGDAANSIPWPTQPFVVTNAQGRYQVRVMPGEVLVQVGRTDDGTARTRRIRLAVQRVSVRAGRIAYAPDIAVSLHPIIVFTGPDGQLVANTTVAVTPKNTAEGNYILDNPTDDTGSIALDHFESGSFRITKDGRYASGTFHCSPDGSVEINVDGQTTNYPSGVGAVHIAEGSVALLMGDVVDENEVPIPNALVSVYEIDPKRRSEVGKQSFRADAAGVFYAPLDPSGHYLTHIRADGFNQVAVSDQPLALAKGATADLSTVPLAHVDAGDFQWTGASVTHLGTIHLVHASGSVSGRVVDSAGKPIAGIVASVDGEKTCISAALTDAQGRFRIPNVVPGEALRLTLCLKGEVPDSGEVVHRSNEQMDFSGVQASPAEREIVWRPRLGGY